MEKWGLNLRGLRQFVTSECLLLPGRTASLSVPANTSNEELVIPPSLALESSNKTTLRVRGITELSA